MPADEEIADEVRKIVRRKLNLVDEGPIDEDVVLVVADYLWQEMWAPRDLAGGAMMSVFDMYDMLRWASAYGIIRITR
jgi:hypothetical protein